jgi:hypothetical protein
MPGLRLPSATLPITVPASGARRRFCWASDTTRMASGVGLKSIPNFVPFSAGANGTSIGGVPGATFSAMAIAVWGLTR